MHSSRTPGVTEELQGRRDCVEKVAERYPDWTLDIFGNGSLKERLEKQIRDNGLEGKVRLMGSSSDIRSEMLASSCLVMSSAYEGFPMVLLEAIETGLPMVSYDCPKGPAEIIVNDENGYLVKPGDTDGLAEGICKVIGDSDRRTRFGKKAKEKAGEFGIDIIMKQWKALFETILEEKTEK